MINVGIMENSEGKTDGQKSAKSQRRIAMTSWLKTTLSGLVGTSIGILLTFGTRAIVEEYKKEKTERLAAMMVINNINEFKEKLDKSLPELERLDTLVCYFYNHPDVEKASEDSAKMLIEAAGHINMNIYDHTVADVFSSNIAMWQSISKPEFISNVGKCFSLMKAYETYDMEYSKQRFDLFCQWQKWVLEQKEPISPVQLAISYLSSTDVMQYYKNYRDFFIPMCRMAAQSLDDVNKVNMNMLGITDEDIREFKSGEDFKRKYDASDYKGNDGQQTDSTATAGKPGK